MSKELISAVKELLTQLDNEHLSEFAEEPIEKVKTLLAAQETSNDPRLTECSVCGEVYYKNPDKDIHSCLL